MKGFYVSASGAIQGHHGPLVSFFHNAFYPFQKEFLFLNNIYFVVCKSKNLLYLKELNLARMMGFVIESVENIGGNGKKWGKWKKNSSSHFIVNNLFFQGN